jgi:hypothetical protein
MHAVHSSFDRKSALDGQLTSLQFKWVAGVTNGPQLWFRTMDGRMGCFQIMHGLIHALSCAGT